MLQNAFSCFPLFTSALLIIYLFTFSYMILNDVAKQAI